MLATSVVANSHEKVASSDYELKILIYTKTAGSTGGLTSQMTFEIDSTQLGRWTTLGNQGNIFKNLSFWEKQKVLAR